MCNRSNNVIHSMWRNDSLGIYYIKYSRLLSFFSKALDKIISTEERIFISIDEPNGSWKYELSLID